MDLVNARSTLKNTRFPHLEWVQETGSTNDDLVALARQRGEGAASDTRVRVADFQTKGRGRLGRRWEAEPGTSLLFSVLLRQKEQKDVALIGPLLGVAVTHVGQRVVDPTIVLGMKWPNDVVINDPRAGRGYRKVAGLLGEIVSHPSGVVDVVIGCGVNITETASADTDDDTRAALISTPTSPVNRVQLLCDILLEFDRLLALPQAEQWQVYREISFTVGQRVRLEMTDHFVEGEAVGIDESGALLVCTAPGHKPQAFHTGDVVHLRPAAVADLGNSCREGSVEPPPKGQDDQ